jgi:hypothetical protein
MHWIHQSNLGTEEQRASFTQALTRLAAVFDTVTWSEVKLVPFEGSVIPAETYTGKVFALGSTSIAVAAKKYGWNPGIIFNEDTFRFEAWKGGWGAENLINGDGIVSKFSEARIEQNQSAFMRPCKDWKSFTGLVLSESELIDWQKRVNEGERNTRSMILDPDTDVVVASEKLVMREWRFFVVDGKVITGSQYRTTYGLSVTPDVDDDVYVFAQKMVDKWQPEKCFVIDIAEVKDGLKIMEVNCINNSGCYACDLLKTFAAIETLYEGS